MQDPASRFGIKDNSNVGPGTAQTGIVYQNLDLFTKTLVQAFIEENILPKRSSSPKRIESEQSSEHSATRHPPLQDASDIRVLELHPGSYEDALRCTSHVCSLGFEYPPAPEDESCWRPWLRYAISRRTGQLIWYSALSYSWGAPIFVKPLTYNGHRVLVTENLDLALRHLRQSIKSVNLWIDQLCINQDDLKEKESQVSLMGRVYERSWNTVIWLGGEADNSSVTLDIIRDFNTIFQFEMESSTIHPDSFAEHHLPIPGSRQWVDISKLLARSWFLRTWVMQEAVLSGEVAVLCGHKCVKWSDIGIFADNLEKQDLVRYLDIEGSITRKGGNSGYRQIRQIDSLKVYQQSSHSLFVEILEQGRGSKATDLRDKVYGMLGMSLATIRPDYLKSVREVYVAFHPWILPSMDLSLPSMDGRIIYGWKEHPWMPPYISSRLSTTNGGTLHGCRRRPWMVGNPMENIYHFHSSMATLLYYTLCRCPSPSSITSLPLSTAIVPSISLSVTLLSLLTHSRDIWIVGNTVRSLTSIAYN